ncbi:hypothetical protein LENED_000672 [Lentinula edodes]|uniref:Uncharacterized protein n=1 Tax=Lentinula edodes TaxID=5353 RepID=A0A1Q3DWB9_LENED|nr:hypothetical protein LENED_000672 [Lentinula edodes]
MLSLFLISTILLAESFGQTSSQNTSVTLWEFGAGRLDSGQSTAPLQPIGTPADGLSTTYLYRVMTSIPSTSELNDDGSPVFTTFVSTATRTIVASASGWIEKFGTTNTIQYLKSHCLPNKHLFLYHTNGSPKIVNDPGNNHWRDNCRIICFIRQRRSLPVSNTKKVDGLLEPFPYTANAAVTRGIFRLYPQVGPSASDQTGSVIPPSKGAQEWLHSLQQQSPSDTLSTGMIAVTGKLRL